MKIKSYIPWLIMLMTQFSAFFAFASATTDLPPVTVVGYTISGSMLQCRGTDCTQSFQAEAAAEFERRQRLYARVSQDDVTVDMSKFCSRLFSKKPASCTVSSPPLSPGYDAGWVADGCGSGFYQKAFASIVLNISNSDTFSGNLDSPHAGISFRSACSSHDRCWANANPRDVCDLKFRDDMTTACRETQGSAYNICSGYASMYHGAVATTDAANNTYNQSVEDRRCAEIAYDLKANECKQQ